MKEYKIVAIGIVALIIIAGALIYSITKEEPVYHTLSGQLTEWKEFSYGTVESHKTEGYLLTIENPIFDNNVSTVQTEHYFSVIGKYYLYQLDNYIGNNVTIHYHILGDRAYVDAIEITEEGS